MKQYQKHQRSRSPEYRVYQMAKDRCTNPNSQRWYTHGGRGIKFLFNSFAEFMQALGPRLSDKHSLDRWPNNNGNYEPGNVRWATRSEQQKNKGSYLHYIRHGKGYYWHKASQKWMIRIRDHGKTIYLGLATTEDRARARYEAALKKIYKTALMEATQ